MADQPCIIGRKITIRGNLSGNEDLIVEGKIEGTIKLANHLVIEPSGILVADLDVEDVTVNGSVQGEVRAARSITINTGARVVGNIAAPRIIIEDGARFKGRVEMDVDLPAELTE